MGNPKNSKYIKNKTNQATDKGTELTGVDISDAKSSVKSKVYFDSLSKGQKNKLARHGRVTIDGITYSSKEIRENGVTPVYQDKIMRSVKDVVEPETSFKDKGINFLNK